MFQNTLMKRCRECNTPFLVKTLIRWQDNGTINMVFNKDMRMVYIHSDIYKDVLSSLEELFGIPLRKLAFETERNNSSSLFQELEHLVPGIHLAGKSRMISGLVLDFFHTLACLFGFGESRTVECVPGKRCVGYEKNPYDHDSFAAQIVGALEFLYQKPFEHKWVDIRPDEYLLIATDTREKPAVSERMIMDIPQLIQGNCRLERCGKCGAPKGLADCLAWYEEDGVIIEVPTGSRIVSFPAYSMATLFRELSKELGSDVCGVLVESQKNWVIDHYRGLLASKRSGSISNEDLISEIEKQLMKFPLYGLGVPVCCTVNDSTLTVKVENPFDLYLLAGYISGLYEVITGKQGSVSWSTTQTQEVTYSVSGKIKVLSGSNTDRNLES